VAGFEVIIEELGNDLQYCGLETCIRGALAHFTDSALHTICDLSEQYAQTCVALFNKLRAKSAECKARCIAITFADDTQTPGLQAADMVAYCARANAVRSTIAVEPIVDKIIALFEDAESERKYFVYRVGGAGLGHGEFEPPKP
jgi:uncharacterized protein DUF3800